MIRLQDIYSSFKKIKEKFERSGYRIYNFAAVEICHWNKEYIRRERACYKNKFYGIETGCCLQISLAAFACTCRCIYCWRPNEEFLPGNGLYLLEEEYKKIFEKPGKILEKLKEFRRNLLIGFLGNKEIPRERVEKCLNVKHVTFSLVGEPLLYPYMPEAIKYIKENWKDVKSIFIVSCGLVPEMIEKLKKENALPTQFYITFTAPNEKLFKEINRPLVKDYWNRFNRSLEILSDCKTRRVARITLIKGINDRNFEEWTKIISKLNPHFIEVKGYTWIGYSQERLSRENMPTMEDIRKFSKKLEKHLEGFEYWNEDEKSLVSCLKNKKEECDIDPIIKDVEPNV